MVELLLPQRGWRAWARGITCAGVLLLASCGGGGDPGGGGGAQAGVGSGGTGSYSNGPITGFGSIVVNGVHYDHTSAVSITKTDGTTHVAADLQLGMMVEVDVAPVGDGGKLNIRYGSDLLGPVDAVDGVHQTLTVMGQVVSTFHISDSNKTQLGPGLTDVADIAPGDVVEVYGFEDASTKVFIATRIERKPAGFTGAYVVRGVIQDLEKDVGGNVIACSIGGQHITYGWSGTAAPVEGMVARAELMRITPPTGSNDWLANKMALSEPLYTSFDRGTALIDGLVTQIDASSNRRFSVNGVDVDASLIDCPVCSTLAVGQRLSIKGARVNGVIMASEIK
jgi:hypothetical protein